MVHVAQDYFTFAFPAKENGCKVFFHVIQVFDDKTREYYTYIHLLQPFFPSQIFDNSLFDTAQKKEKTQQQQRHEKKNGISIS